MTQAKPPNRSATRLSTRLEAKSSETQRCWSELPRTVGDPCTQIIQPLTFAGCVVRNNLWPNIVTDTILLLMLFLKYIAQQIILGCIYIYIILYYIILYYIILYYIILYIYICIFKKSHSIPDLSQLRPAVRCPATGSRVQGVRSVKITGLGKFGSLEKKLQDLSSSMIWIMMFRWFVI